MKKREERMGRWNPVIFLANNKTGLVRSISLLVLLTGMLRRSRRGARMLPPSDYKHVSPLRGDHPGVGWLLGRGTKGDGVQGEPGLQLN